MRNASKFAFIGLLTAAAPTVAEAQSAIVYDAIGQDVGLSNDPTGATGVVLLVANGHTYAVNASIQLGFLGYDFLHTSTDCSGQPYALNVNSGITWPAQYYVGPSQYGMTGNLYGPTGGGGSGSPNLAMTYSLIILSEEYNSGNVSRVCTAISNTVPWTVSKVGPLGNVSGYRPPFAVKISMDGDK